MSGPLEPSHMSILAAVCMAQCERFCAGIDAGTSKERAAEEAMPEGAAYSPGHVPLSFGFEMHFRAPSACAVSGRQWKNGSFLA